MCVNSFISVWNLTSDVTKTGKTGKYTRSLRMLFRDTAYYFTSFFNSTCNYFRQAIQNVRLKFLSIA